MSATENSLQLPNYETFSHSIANLGLPISSSELHGVLCGYLAAGASHDGETYIRALMTNKNAGMTRDAALALFNLYTTTQQQMTHQGFEFQLFLPEDTEELIERAEAFSEWCEGFSQGITMAGIHLDDLHDEETQEALQHITEFAELDYQSIQIDAEDEQSLLEVCEYARVAVMHIYSDLNTNTQSQTTH
jgi:yecA family protein